MFEELFIGAAFVIIAFFVYKWFELIVLKKERLNIVSRLEGESLLEYAKRLPIGIRSGGVKQEEVVVPVKTYQTPPHGKVLRWGLFFLGIGMGLFMASRFVVEMNPHNEDENSLIIVGLVLLCGGASLVLSFIIEHLIFKKEK